MSSQGADGFLVAFAPGNALVEATDVTARPAAAIEADGIGGFDEGPLEVAIDVRAARPEAGLVAAGVDAQTFKEATRVHIGQGGSNVGFSKDGRTAFIGVTVANAVAVIDVDRLTVTGRIDTGKG